MLFSMRFADVGQQVRPGGVPAQLLARQRTGDRKIDRDEVAMKAAASRKPIARILRGASLLQPKKFTMRLRSRWPVREPRWRVTSPWIEVRKLPRNSSKTTRGVPGLALLIAAVLLVLAIGTWARADEQPTSDEGQAVSVSRPSETAKSLIDTDGSIRVPTFEIPFSALASTRAKENLLESVDRQKEAGSIKSVSAAQTRQRADDIFMRPGVKRLRRTFAVQITPMRIGGVRTDVVTPVQGVAPENASRVLINLHGGGFAYGTSLTGQMESIPIASLARIKVISVDYRQGPEYRFPAASQDVANVYRELLKDYRPENIGIYGCSAGGWLAAEAVPWFQTHDLPRPGALGVFGAGAMIFDGVTGDSAYVGWLLSGALSTDRVPMERFSIPYFDVPGLDLNDPLVSPARSLRVLAKFPPTLIISGTRDFLFSEAIFTHSRLVRVGVDTELHVWEGAYHCSFAEGVVDPKEPETREAWDVIVKFFESRLGVRP
jgi:epsilon-lactone hydrolase